MNPNGKIEGENVVPKLDHVAHSKVLAKCTLSVGNLAFALAPTRCLMLHQGELAL